MKKQTAVILRLDRRIHSLDSCFRRNDKVILSILLISFIFFSVFCSGAFAQEEKMQLTSPAFKNDENIPAKYTCDGPNVSPPLKWTSLPQNTQTLALIADDPDAPRRVWVHWVIYNIPATLGGLPEFVPAGPLLSTGGMQGTNDFRQAGYGGPCPPAGFHRYEFKIYALDAPLDLRPGASKSHVLKAMEGHVLGEALLMTRYRRS